MNPYNQQPVARFNPILNFAVVALLLLFAFNLVSALRAKNNTGTLTISTFASDATISISQNNKAAQIVGTGSASLLLQPGTYEVAASSAGYTTATQVHVSKNTHASVRLKKNQPSPLPSPDDINFTGMETVIANGITTDQAVSIRTLFFKYKQSTKAVTINPSSVLPGPRDPNSDAPFTLNFTGTIDSVAYKATLTYTDLENVQLTIFDPQTDATLFTGDSAQ